MFSVPILCGEGSAILQGTLGNKDIYREEEYRPMGYFVFALLLVLLFFSHLCSSFCCAFYFPVPIFLLHFPLLNSYSTAHVCTSTASALQTNKRKKKMFQCLLYLPLYLGDIFPKWQESRTLTKVNCPWMCSKNQIWNDPTWVEVRFNGYYRGPWDSLLMWELTDYSAFVFLCFQWKPLVCELDVHPSKRTKF